MEEDSVYRTLGKLTEEMYQGIVKTQSAKMQDQLMAYHALAEGKLSGLMEAMSRCGEGRAVSDQKRKMQILCEDFGYMKRDIGSKYKIYIRGCGKAGKSTLLNALLSLDEAVGSRMGRLPMTFILDTYSDELPVEEAEIRVIDPDGKGRYLRAKRADATAMENREEEAFRESREKCRRMIEEKSRNVFLEKEREDIEKDIYSRNLMRTTIREIKWGIGENNFFHNCFLIDTPGLSQELRFTNTLEEIKSYEVDGIIWVISSGSLEKQEVIDAYRHEFEEMQEIYSGKKVIAVINMYGAAPDFVYGSRLWTRVEKRARKIFCDREGFDDLICVNAKLAYDGNLAGDQRLLEESNIAELRRKINEMFVEKSSEAHHAESLSKIDSFLHNLYREVENGKRELEQFAAQYRNKEDKLASQASACRGMLDEQKEKVVDRYLSDIRGRIEANLDRINQLDSETIGERERFLKEEIVHANELEQDLLAVTVKCRAHIFDRFHQQQRQCVVSDFQTEAYAVESFRKENGNGLADNGSELPSFWMGLDHWDWAELWVDSNLGDNQLARAAKGVLRFVKNVIKSPSEWVYEGMKKSIKRLSKEFDLTEEINTCRENCREILNISMRQACGKYEDVLELVKYMEEFIADQPRMEWEKVGLRDLIGGTENV